MKIQKEVLNIFYKLDIEEAEPSHYLADNLGMDSQEILLLVVEIEKRFSVKFQVSEIKRNMRVIDVINLVDNKLTIINSTKENKYARISNV